MVRLMLTLTPVVCILSGVAFSGLLDVFLKEDGASDKLQNDEQNDQPTERKQLYDKVSVFFSQANMHSKQYVYMFQIH